jgi:GNAT superfamily N-acetyltransferase
VTPALLTHRPNQDTPEFRAFVASLPPVIREGYEAMHKSEHGLQRRSFPDNSNLYWIAFLATSPKAQGQGLAKALLARVRERAAAEGKIVALLTQTKENVSAGRALVHGRCPGRLTLHTCRTHTHATDARSRSMRSLGSWSRTRLRGRCATPRSSTGP